jgi:transcriptional regulator GlxA family with amidase domain
MVLANALEPLRAARDLPKGPNVAWSIATLSGDTATSSSGIAVSTSTDLETLEGLDFVFLVAGYGYHESIDASSLAKLQRLRGKTLNIVGLDAGAWLMARAGFLDGHEATIHWQELGAFREAFPRVTALAQNHVFSNNRITCGDASAVFETTLEIIRKQFGDAVAFDVSNLFRFDLGRSAQTQTGHQNPRGAGSNVLRSAVRVMSAHIEAPIALEELAAQVGVSISTLYREFQSELGCAPVKHYRNLRLDHARRLVLETRLQNVDIAQRSGFGSASILCRAFAAHFGTTISDLRRRP